ncbi:flagellar motor protein MotB [Flavobacterium psychrophilum]|uniref:Probable outer membrane protein, OmpA family n=4 Tax=Flavobacterium psychrophilum TaxID=96345 RepID=A6H0W2_FLAPJ|nr:DUF5723 family protein [Flavobacterium psychrophilum]AIG30667.1 flagellar motor protein MotB [Flavobacterium psychrophilum]AIG32942.1 flagellar motor protein MotB [Flavobacterium psychrophilum]AIG35097.1 flagellar motor protein MotB [Flavobacterium psychrophilum]AIG37462.1 flagellar motor protein MotB [Flavobacterium psychrophilum]AIG39726.1 flagellar motor protein MotB [Flavobacterium psychrophilum]
MKNKFLLLFVFTSLFSARAQSYLGYYYDNYAGVQSVLYNPASIVDSRFKTDINLASVSGSVGNDYYGFSVSDLLKGGDYDFELQSKKFPSRSNNFVANVDIMGPSFMFNIAPKHSLALFTRGRSIANVRNIDGDLFNKLRSDFSASKDYSINSQNFSVVANAWAELGLSYAAVLLNKNQHFIKGGFSLKYMQGIGNSYINANNVSLAYDNKGSNANFNTIATTGTLTYGGSQEFENTDYKFDRKSIGFGGDLGFIYEYRPDYASFSADDKNLNKYKLRFGLSVTDIGSITYKEATQRTHNLNGVRTEAQYDNLKSTDYLNTFSTSFSDAQKMSLPTAIHTNLDWNFYKKFYLNLNSDMSLTSKTALNTNSIENAVSLTPRYEVKWFSFYLPVSYMQYSNLRAGFGFRAGPLFVGSGSVISNLISNESKGIDMHLGLKIPIYQGNKKDKDNDGVLDKFDDCPETAGPIENKGCPWKDTDNDTVLDKDDKCPTIAGPAKNKGCPYEDTDKDGVLDEDDKCINEAGPIENKGCPYLDTDKDGTLDKDDKCPTIVGDKENAGCPWPDTDGDSVLDKDDKCPTVKGTIKNNGCPEVTADVMKKLNDYAKTILFEVSKSSFQQRTFPVLQSILAILKEYPVAKFSIEGHTDSDGKDTANQTLSETRAAAVMAYLVKNGIDASRLASKGFGESKPIATNKTKVGKILNRRVEVKLVN